MTPGCALLRGQSPSTVDKVPGPLTAISCQLPWSLRRLLLPLLVLLLGICTAAGRCIVRFLYTRLFVSVFSIFIGTGMCPVELQSTNTSVKFTDSNSNALSNRIRTKKVGLVHRKVPSAPQYGLKFPCSEVPCSLGFLSMSERKIDYFNPY
jgi:hypothetical protein